LREVLFFLAAFGAIGGALAVILVRNPFYSVLSLVIHLFALATLFLLLTAEFLAAAQIVVYAGAVMVLYVFVVAYIGGIQEPLRGDVGGIGKLGVLFAGGLLVVITTAVVGSGLAELDSEGARVADGFGSPGAIGELLLRRFLVPFEAASILLLVAAVGAVVLARKRRGLPESEGHLVQSMPGAGTGPGSSRLLGGLDVEATGLPHGTAAGPGDPAPRQGTPVPNQERTRP
jgi:NADH:ubiquinone oxidoreductase subunit 6 (subunit J)